MGLIKKLFKGQKADHELRKPAPMGTPQQPRGVPALQALDKLHETLELLEKKRAYLERRMDKELEQAREQLKTNKKGALAAMKRKKALEIQVQHLQNNIDRVNEQMTTLEGTGMTATVLDSLSYASKASKETMQSLNVTDVDRVLESINDQNQQMQEIHEAMAQPLGAAADIDDEELLNELEGLTMEPLEGELGEETASAVPVRTAAAGRAPKQGAPAAVAAKGARASTSTAVQAGTAATARRTPQKSVEELELDELEAELAS